MGKNRYGFDEALFKPIAIKMEKLGFIRVRKTNEKVHSAEFFCEKINQFAYILKDNFDPNDFTICFSPEIENELDKVLTSNSDLPLRGGKRVGKWKKNNSFDAFRNYLVSNGELDKSDNKSPWGYPVIVDSLQTLEKVMEVITSYLTSNNRPMNANHTTSIHTETNDEQANLSSTEKKVDEVTLRAIKTRYGQPAFRKALLSVYDYKCVITGFNVLSVLEAAHIVPHSDETNYSVHNGFLMRSDIHTLFDLGLLKINYIDGKLKVELSEELEESEYQNYEGHVIGIEPSKEMLANITERNKKYLND